MNRSRDTQWLACLYVTQLCMCLCAEESITSIIQQPLGGRHYSRRVSCHINWWPQMHTRTHVHTRKLCFAARCRKQVKYCTLQNKENVGDNPDSRKMWTLSKTSIQTECDCLLMLFHIHSTERRYISCFTWKGSAALTFYTVDQLFWNQGHMLMTFPTEAAARQYAVCDNSQLESFQLRPWRKYSWQNDSLSHFWPSSPN